jgi:hypothetical protein
LEQQQLHSRQGSKAFFSLQYSDRLWGPFSVLSIG